jgi:hypothetical protein
VAPTTGEAPTKALQEAAVDLTDYRQEEVYGIRAAAPLDVVFATIQQRIERVMRCSARSHARSTLVVSPIYISDAALSAGAMREPEGTPHIASAPSPDSKGGMA